MPGVPEPLLSSGGFCIGVQPVPPELESAAEVHLLGNKRRGEQLDKELLANRREGAAAAEDEAEAAQDAAAAQCSPQKPLAAKRRIELASGYRTMETAPSGSEAAPVAFQKVIGPAEAAIRVPLEVLYAVLLGSGSHAGAEATAMAGTRAAAEAAAAPVSLAEQAAAVDAVEQIQLRVVEEGGEVVEDDIVARVTRVKQRGLQPEPGELYR
jgi:hypothetical protein